MKERKKYKGGKDEEVNRQGKKRGAPAPHVYEVRVNSYVRCD